MKKSRYFLILFFSLFLFIPNAHAEFRDYFAEQDAEKFSPSVYRASGKNASDVKAQCVYNSAGRADFSSSNTVLEVYTDGTYKVTSVSETGYALGDEKIENWSSTTKKTNEVASDLFKTSGCPAVYIYDFPMLSSTKHYLVSASESEKFKYKEGLVYSSYASETDESNFGTIGDISGYDLECPNACSANNCRIYYRKDGSIVKLDYDINAISPQFYYINNESAEKNKTKIAELVKNNQCPNTYVTVLNALTPSYSIYFDKSEVSENATEHEGNEGNVSVCSQLSTLLGSSDSSSIGYNYAQYNATGDGNYMAKANRAIDVTATYCESVYATARYDSECLQTCLNRYKIIANLKVQNGIDMDDESSDCYISADLVQWILKIVNWIRYLVPVLLIILSVLDFIKAIASDSDDEMKKVTARFVKRLIAAVLIFLIPLLLEFVLGIFDIPTKGFCL